MVGGGITGAGVALDAAVAWPADRAASTRATSRRARRRSRRSSCTAASATCSRRRSGSSTRRSPNGRCCARPRPHLVRVLPFLLPVFTGRPAAPAARPAARHRRCGCTTSPAACASASCTSASPRSEALAYMPTLPRRQHRGVVHLLRRAGRRRAAHAHDREDRGRPRRRGRELRDARRAHQGRAGKVAAHACTSTATRSTCGRAPSSTRPACGPTTSARSTRARTRARSGPRRASTSRCRGRSCATRSRSSSRCRRTGARCSSCRGAARRPAPLHVHRHDRHRLRRPDRRPADHPRRRRATSRARSTAR